MKSNKEIQKAGYLFTGKLDDNGIPIYQGSIINADGYKSNLKENYFQCVEFEDGQFTSIIYGDSDPLETYESIVVVGHVLDYLEVYYSCEWSGNLGSALIGEIVAGDFGFYDNAKCEAITTEGRKQLRHLVDVVWNHVTESEEVPSTKIADMLINKALNIK